MHQPIHRNIFFNIQRAVYLKIEMALKSAFCKRKHCRGTSVFFITSTWQNRKARSTLLGCHQNNTAMNTSKNCRATENTSEMVFINNELTIILCPAQGDMSENDKFIQQHKPWLTTTENEKTSNAHSPGRKHFEKITI